MTAQFSNHSRLAMQGGELTASLHAEGVGALSIDFGAAGLPDFLSDYFYEVSPWPVLISHEVRDGFVRMVEELPGLICRAVLAYYEHSPERFSAQFRVHELAYHLLADVNEISSGLLTRYDLVFTDFRPRLLEANVGTNVGGWQTGWLGRQFAAAINSRPDFGHLTLSQTSPIETFLSQVRHASRAHVGKRATGNILLMLEDYYVKHGFAAELAEIFEGMPGSGPAKLLFDVDLKRVSFDEHGRAVYNGEVLDCILMTASPSGATHIVELSRAHMRRLVYFPDNAIYTILGDKTNFAAMHAMRSAGKLSDSDAELVEKYIPWSAFLTDEPTVWNGKEASAADIARQNQDSFVIKRGHSYQGKDVFVGKYLSAAEWSDVIAAACEARCWVLQEFCQPDRLYAPAGAEVVEHDAIWGVFGFCGKYGGSWGRLMESETGAGVANCARGAKEFVVLEV